MAIIDIPSGEDVQAVINNCVPGDTVRLQKGGIYNQRLIISKQGNAELPITLTSYGSGSMPVLTTRAKLPQSDDPDHWVNVSGNIWSYTHAEALSFYPRIWLNGVEYMQAEINSQISSIRRTRWFNGDPQILYVYATSNPAIFYTSIEYPSTENNTLDIANAAYISVSDISIQGSLGSCVDIEFSNFINITSCNIGKDAGRLGVRYNHANDVVLQDCVIDSGCRLKTPFLIEFGIGDAVYLSGASKRCTVRRNLIRNFKHSGIEITDNLPDESLDDISVYYNLVEGPDVDYFRPFAADYNNGNNIVVEYNYFRNSPVQCQIQGQGIIFRYNIIENITNCIHQDIGTGVGIKLSGYSHRPKDMQFYNNLITRCEGPGLELAGTLNDSGLYEDVIGNSFLNNIIFNNGLNVKNLAGNDLYTPHTQLVIRLNKNVKSNIFKNNLIYSSFRNDCIHYLGANISNLNSVTGINNTASGNINSAPNLSPLYSPNLGSPVLYTGLNLPTGNNIALSSDSVWPETVMHKPQGENWNIGPFVSEVFTAPVILGCEVSYS